LSDNAIPKTGTGMTDASAQQPVLVIMGVAGCAVAARPAEIIRRLGLRAEPFSSAFAMRQC